MEADPVRMRVLLEAGLGCCDWQIKVVEAWLVLADIEARGQASLHEGAATKTSQSGEQNRTQDICCTHTYTHMRTHMQGFTFVQHTQACGQTQSHTSAAKDRQSCMLMATNSNINTLLDMHHLFATFHMNHTCTHTQLYTMSYQESCRYPCTVRFVCAEKGGERKKQSVKTVCDRVCAGKVWGDSSLVRNNKKHIHERCRGVVQQHKRETEWSVGAESADHIHLICLLFLLSVAQNLFHNNFLLYKFSHTWSKSHTWVKIKILC